MGAPSLSSFFLAFWINCIKKKTVEISWFNIIGGTSLVIFYEVLGWRDWTLVVNAKIDDVYIYDPLKHHLGWSNVMETEKEKKNTYCYCAQAQFDINMQAHGYNQTACYNDNCTDFVQVNNNKAYTLGNVMSTNSIGSTEKVASFLKIKQVNF